MNPVFVAGEIINLKIIPNSGKTEIVEQMTDGVWKMRVKAIPEKGKANQEIERYFKKVLKKSIVIIMGKTQGRKRVRIED